MAFPTRFALLPLTALLAACGLVEPDLCPDLDEVCPDLVCDDYQQNRDGCSMCACEGDAAPATVCWEEADCEAGQRCDVVNFCEPAPGCTEGEPCPDACYGRCVDAPSPCSSDADCREGQICSLFANERPAAPDASPGGEGDAPNPGAPEPAPPPSPPPTGVCQDVSCGEADVALPECPPGSELVFDSDACGPACLPVDFCRELLPEECRGAPGCTLVSEGCACADGEECDCTSIERCVAINDCSLLSLEQCETNPSCVLKPIGNLPPPVGDPLPCECDANAPDCPCSGGGGGVPPPPSDLVCVPRGSDGTCLGDGDCLAGDVCVLSTVCGSGCSTGADGQEQCFEECWSERGICIPSERTCFDLPPNECAVDPRCELVEGTDADCFCDATDPNCACVGLPTTSCRPRADTCSSTEGCLPGQHCQFVETCPPCNPSSNDIDCLAPCFSEGTCIDGTPPPQPCSSDAECHTGDTCVPVTICQACDGQAEAIDRAQPVPPCDPVCRDESVCVPADPVCFSDAECGDGSRCDLSQCDVVGLLPVQCPGTCVVREALCQQDDQCATGQRCATELDHCLVNAAAPGCWTVCVDDAAAQGVYCLSNDQCGEGAQCRFLADVCLNDPSSDVQLCSGWCTGACAEILTPARDQETGQCAVFEDSCIPPGWVRADGGC